MTMRQRFLVALVIPLCLLEVTQLVAGFGPIHSSLSGRSRRERPHHGRDRSCVRTNARRRNRSRDVDAEGDGWAKTTVPPQLPPSGNASNGRPLSRDGGNATTTSDTALVGRKLQLQYTCAKCDTRNSHYVSRLAYTKGLVIATCKGCQVKHLIADNLGVAGNYQIEEAQTVHRVSKDQYDISLLYNSYDTRSGAIVGQDGKMALE